MSIREFLSCNYDAKHYSKSSNLNSLLSHDEDIHDGHAISPITTSRGITEPLFQFLNQHDHPIFTEEEHYSRLFSSPSTCLFLFKLFDQYTQYHVLRLLFIRGRFEISQLRQWVPKEHKNRQNDILGLLKRWHVLQGQDKWIWLNETFQSNLQRAFSCDPNQSFLIPKSLSMDKSPDFYELYSEDQWTNILLTMVEKSVQNESRGKPSISALPFLQGGGRLGFFLQSRSTQLWQLLLYYLDFLYFKDFSNQSSGFDRASFWLESLTFLFQLALSPKDKPISMTCVKSKFIKNSLISELHQIGLVFPIPHQDVFIVTHLADNLFPGLANQIETNGSIIVETNFKVYAYTKNPLYIAILSLFVQFKAQFQNFVSGILTRESVHRAFDKGIRASHIISYLEEHAHPYMKRFPTTLISLPVDSLVTKPVDNATNANTQETDKSFKRSDISLTESIIPVTVKEQLCIWEKEKYRIQHEPAFLYSQFMDHIEYEKAKQFAKSQGHLLLAMDTKRILIITQIGHEAIKAFMRES